MSEPAAGRRLAAWRHLQSPPLTQAQLGTLVGVHHSRISRIEAGSAKPSAKLARAIEVETGIPEDAWGPLRDYGCAECHGGLRSHHLSCSRVKDQMRLAGRGAR